MKVNSYHSVNETTKPSPVYHTHNDCRSGRDIQLKERVKGTGGYRLCKHCRDMD